MSPPKATPGWLADLDTLRKSSRSLFPKATSQSRAKMSNGYTTSAGAICHGRVNDLESMVPPQWWQTVFADAMYLKTDGDVVEDPDITKEEVGLLEADKEIQSILLRGSGKAHEVLRRVVDHRFAQIHMNQLSSVAYPLLVTTRLGRPARILDLCCGQGRHVLQLAKDYPHLSLHGHDQSSYLISLAQERAASQGLAAKTVFTVGDCRQIPYADESFDLVVVMGNSFGYFSDEDGDRVVLREILRVLAPEGRMVLDLTDGDYMRKNFAERSWEWIDDTTFVCRERQLSKDGLRLSSREVVTLTTKGVIRDQFYRERLYGKKEVETLVQEIGFTIGADEKESDPITLGKELSKRKEDLGMMEQRVLVTAVKPARQLNGDAQVPHLTNGVHPVTAKSNGHHHHNHGISNGLRTNGEHTSMPVDTALASGVPRMVKMVPAPFEQITVLLGDPSQRCFGKLNNTWNPEDIDTRRKLLVALNDLGYPPNAVKVLDRHDLYIRELSQRPPQFVFNLCDEGFDNDALKELHVPALLDMLKIPYSGAGPNCLAYCYDKGLVNRTAAAIGVPTPKETFYFADTATPAVHDISNLHSVISKEIGYPAFIKPVKGDNSLGITGRSIVNNEKELDAYMAELRSIGIRDVLVQEYLQGTEYGVGMIGNRETGFHFFPILEVDYSQITAKSLPPILGYESKWDPTSPYWTDITYKEATTLSPKSVSDLHEWCIALWDRFECRDYARFDFRSDKPNGTIKLLEVNPNPGWCWDGKLAYMGKLEGFAYRDVVGTVLKSAWERLNGTPASSKPKANGQTNSENGETCALVDAA
ncbi:D-alanine---D-alanine ligase [Spizellomyces sp. 'palustris']|nr:D-alanine---D-alanine ligase [Spizellomyces sp. 'palustris']